MQDGLPRVILLFFLIDQIKRPMGSARPIASATNRQVGQRSKVGFA